ncbi:MAG: recombination mediator RecR [Nitrospira sp.]|nr:recombination mediator RecR [Nitrospira sp.]MCY4132690.1 recombination mediator RecR [Nitrospira sp.]
MSVQQRQGLLAKLAKEFVRLPGIGQKTSQRLAFHMMKVSKEEALRLADAIRDVKEFVVFCEQCRNIAESELCDICQDPQRDRTRILVVEEPSTLHAIDQSRGYKGLYHVLMGSISPLDGVGPSDIRVSELEARVRDGGVKEVIVATNPTIEGEATAIYLTKLLKPYGVTVSRIAYGIPVGMDIEYADDVTLTKSIEGRREL